MIAVLAWSAILAGASVALLSLVMAMRAATQVDSRNTYTSISGRRRSRSDLRGSGFAGKP